MRLAFQGTSFCLSDTRTQGRGTPKEVRTALFLLSGVLLLLLRGPFYLTNFPRPSSNPRAAQRAHRMRSGPCVPAGSILPTSPRAGRRETGGRGTPNPPPPSPRPARRSEQAQPKEAEPRSRHRGLWARPALRPLNGRLCSSPGAAERALGRRHNAPAPTPAPCAKAPCRPLPCAPASSQLSSTGCSRLNCLLYVLLTFI